MRLRVIVYNESASENIFWKDGSTVTVEKFCAEEIISAMRTQRSWRFATEDDSRPIRKFFAINTDDSNQDGLLFATDSDGNYFLPES